MASIDNIINELDDLLENSWNLPLSGGRCVLDAERVRDLIDGIRLNMPSEIKQAKAVVSDRSEILAMAKNEAETLIRKAEERAKVLVDNETVVRNATAKAAAILSEANTKASALLGDANARASALISDANTKANAMVEEATSRSSEMMTQASQRSREMKQAAYDFSENMLRSSEETMAKTLSEVKSTRQALRDSAEAYGRGQSQK